MSLELEADITGLRGAEYNPRQIAEEDLEALAASITSLGLVKPLIVRGNLLVAGHQRTRALRHLGVTKAALFRLSADTTVYDEVRFNQLHNGTDLDAGDERAHITGGFDAPGWHVIPSNRLTANFRGQLAGVRNDIAVLIHKYGPWGGVVSTLSGEIIHAAQYGLAARLSGVPLTVHVLPDDKVEIAKKMLSRTYGVFSYDRLERKTYIQTLAQMNRLRGGPSGKENKSTLYETMVIPYALANPAGRYIDFGSGHGDYAAAMRRRGLDFHDVELFRRNAHMTLDERVIRGMVDRLCADLAERGPYDAVVCDSVLNSVDSLGAETAVMTTINALAKVGGKLFFSGRPGEVNDHIARYTKRNSLQQRRAVEFLDPNGFTAIYRQGNWFYQKYHRKAEAVELAERFGFKVEKQVHSGNSWQITAKKIADLPIDMVESAFDFEFNLPLGEEKRLYRHEDVKRAYAVMQWRNRANPA